MPPLLTIPLGMLPGLLWLWVIQRKDVREPEPCWLVVLGLGLGALAAGGVLLLRPSVDAALEPMSAAVDAFVATAVPEEALKLLALLPLLLLRETDEPLDGAVYGVAVAMGFAAVENIRYLEVSESAGVLWQRAFTATLAHACFTGSLGFCLAHAKLVRPRLPWVAGGVAGAVLLHGAYDLFLLGGGPAPVALLAVLPVALFAFAAKVRLGQRAASRFHG